jgi:hypothetical protein
MEQKTADSKCICDDGQGSLQNLVGVTCEQAKAVTNASPPGGGQSYQPFQVPGLGTWETEDAIGSDMQPYKSADGSASFAWYSCARYPESCQPECVSYNGSLEGFSGVGCYEARIVINVSPPGGGQNYESFPVPGLGTWLTDDQTKSGQQPYESADGSASFIWYKL